MYSLLKNPVLAAALISSSSTNNRNSQGSRRLTPDVYRPPAATAAALPAQPSRAALSGALSNAIAVKLFSLPPGTLRGKPSVTATQAWGFASAQLSLPLAGAYSLHASLSSSPWEAPTLNCSVIARAQESSPLSDLSPQEDKYVSVEALWSPSSSLAAGTTTRPVFQSCSCRNIETAGAIPTCSNLKSFMPLSSLKEPAYSHFQIHRSNCPPPYAAFVSPVLCAPASAGNAASSLLSSTSTAAGHIPLAGEKCWLPEEPQWQIRAAETVAGAPVIAATRCTTIAGGTSAQPEAIAAEDLTVRPAPPKAAAVARVRTVGGVTAEIGWTKVAGQDLVAAAPPVAANHHGDTAVRLEAAAVTFDVFPPFDAPTGEGMQVTMLSQTEKAAPPREGEATDKFRPLADVARSEIVVERDVLSKDASATAAAAAARCANTRVATATWTASNRCRISHASGAAAANAGGVDAAPAFAEEHNGWDKDHCLNASRVSEAEFRAAEVEEEDAPVGGGGIPVEAITKRNENVSFLLRGGGGEWTNEGGSEREEDVIFSGKGDALFFPAFPVHRCRGVSLWDVETNERVCLGKFEETAGLLLLTPDTLTKLALSFHTPFFDGVVLRSFVGPPRSANEMDAHGDQPHHRNRSRPSERSSTTSARTRSTSAAIGSAENTRNSSAARGASTDATAVGGGAEHEPVVRHRDRVAAASQSSSGSTARDQAVNPVTDVSTTADFVSSLKEGSRTVHTHRSTPSDKKQRSFEPRSGKTEHESPEVSKDATSAMPRTDQTRDVGAPRKSLRRGNRESSSSAVEKVSKDENSAGVDAVYGGSQQSQCTPSEVVGTDAASVTDLHDVKGESSRSRHRKSASPPAAGEGSRGAETATEVVSTQANEAASASAARKVDELASAETQRKRGREGVDEGYETAQEREAERPDHAEDKRSATSPGGQRSRHTKRGKEQQPVSNASGRAPVTGARGAGTETVRVLEGVLIDPEELLEAMAAKHEQQQPHASVDGQWMRFERPRANAEYKLCIGESYWMAMKIPLEACNPFLLNRNDVVVDLIEPQQEQEELPRSPTEGIPTAQRRPSRSSEVAPGAATAANGHQHHSESRGRPSLPASNRSRGGAAAGTGSETSNSYRGDILPPSLPAGAEDDAELQRPRTFTGWLGKQVSDRMNRIAAIAPGGLTNAVNRLVDTLPTTPDEAEELGKKWTEHSVRAGRAVSASAKLLLKSFRHAATELWFLITEGKGGSSSTGG